MPNIYNTYNSCSGCNGIKNEQNPAVLSGAHLCSSSSLSKKGGLFVRYTCHEYKSIQIFVADVAVVADVAFVVIVALVSVL